MEFNYKDYRPYELKINKKTLIRAFKTENEFIKFMNELIEKLINKQ